MIIQPEEEINLVNIIKFTTELIEKINSVYQKSKNSRAELEAKYDIENLNNAYQLYVYIDNIINAKNIDKIDDENKINYIYNPQLFAIKYIIQGMLSQDLINILHTDGPPPSREDSILFKGKKLEEYINQGIYLCEYLDKKNNEKINPKTTENITTCLDTILRCATSFDDEKTVQKIKTLAKKYKTGFKSNWDYLLGEYIKKTDPDNKRN